MQVVLPKTQHTVHYNNTAENKRESPEDYSPQEELMKKRCLTYFLKLKKVFGRQE